MVMAPPPWSVGLQTPEPVSARYPSLVQQSSEALCSTPALQPLGPEDFSCGLDQEPD